MDNSIGVNVSDRAKGLLAEACVIEGRDPSFLMYRFTGDDKPEYWESIRKSGITSICVDPAWVDFRFRDAAVDFASWYKRIRENNAILVETTEDIVRAKKEGKPSFIFAHQSPDPMEDEIGFIEVLYRMGLRIMEFSYFRQNYLSGGGTEAGNVGLSKLGFEALKEMNRVGIVADLAHSTDKAMMDVLEHSEKPVINSHSCVKALCDHRRNSSDDILKALGERKGVYCVCGHSAFLKKDGGKTGSTLDDWVRHIDYLLNLIGPDCVGIGYDVGEGRNDSEMAILGSKAGISSGGSIANRYTKEMQSRANFPLIVEKLIEQGYSDEVIKKIIGGNLMRVFKEVWGK